MAKAELDKLGKLENDILTPEERAALAEDDPEEEAAAQKRAGTHVAPTAKGADPNDDDDDDDAEKDKKGDAAAETEGEQAKPAITDPAAAAAAAPAKDEAATGADSTPDRPQAFVPQLPKVDIPADAAAKLATRRAELEAKQTALDKEHDDGEMATAAYRALQAGLRKEEKAIDREEFALESAVRENKRIDEANRSMEQQLWASQCEHFIATHEQYKSKVMEGALNAAVIAVANSEEGKTKKGFWILEQAHRAVMKEFGQRCRAGVRRVFSQPRSTLMSKTVIGLNDAKAVKRYSGNLAVDTARKSYFSKKFMGVGEDSSMPVQMLTATRARRRRADHLRPLDATAHAAGRRRQHPRESRGKPRSTPTTSTSTRCAAV
jgi:hypothetical protein